MNIQTLEKEYKAFQVIKKDCPKVADAMVLMNQKLLTAAGAFHTECLKTDDTKAFEEFTNTFIGSYYNEWKKTQAVSVAACMGIYKTLNVKMDVADCKGETFYAGIPQITEEEVAAVQDVVTEKGFVAFSEKIGIDGKLHTVDECGAFSDDMDLWPEGDKMSPQEEYDAACAVLQDVEDPTEEQMETYLAAEKKYYGN